jgi:hypothetical protein
LNHNRAYLNALHFNQILSKSFSMSDPSNNKRFLV